MGQQATLLPKVPNNAYFDEEGDIPRICFSTSIFYCVRSIIGCKRLRTIGLIAFKDIYTPEEELKFNNPNIYVTNKKLYTPPACSDFKYNKEYWALDPTEVNFIGLLCLKNLVNGILKTTDIANTLDSQEWWNNKSNYILLSKLIKLI